MKSSIALAALVVAVIGTTSVVPSFAQETSPTAAAPAPIPAASRDDHGRQMHRFMDRRDGGGMRMMGPRFLALVCSDRGSERLEIALVRLSHRLDLTADQQKLFDTFRSKALTTQTAFADSCKAAMPEKPADGAKPDLLTGLKAGLEMEKARLTALTEVLPDFEAFYNSLTDAQKAKLMPHRDMGRDNGRGPGQHGDMFRLGPPRS